MVIHSLEWNYLVIYRRRTEPDFEIMICSREAADSRSVILAEGETVLPQTDLGGASGCDGLCCRAAFTLLRFSQKEEIHRLLEQNMLQEEISGNFQDYMESFLWQDSLFMVFARREGTPLSQWLAHETHPLSLRLEVGKHLLERFLLLNMPEYLLEGILNEECILVTESLQVVLRYEPETSIGRNRRSEEQIGLQFYQVFFRLFQEEASRQLCKEIPDFLEQIRQKPYEDVFHIYQCYDRLLGCLTGKADCLQPFGWKERLNRLGEGLKKIGEGLLVPVLIVAGMAVLIYGICCPAGEEPEEFRFEQIGTLEIQK